MLFVVSEHLEDEVHSKYYPIVVSGTEYKPEDYLNMFKNYINEHPDEIEGIEILLKRPQDMTTEILADLREKLAKRPEQYTEERLRRAYGNNLADIIGMVRSTITNEPILSTRERVQKAIGKVTKRPLNVN